VSIGEVAEGDEAPFKPPGRAVVSIDAQLACVGREIGIRRNVYPRWINQARMTREAAAREIAAMEAVYETLQLVRRATVPPTAAR
jgi:hypothetical protein